MSDLKPCPFCGEAPQMETVGIYTGIVCRTRGCMGAESNGKTADAIAAWNRRTGAAQGGVDLLHFAARVARMSYFESGKEAEHADALRALAVDMRKAHDRATEPAIVTLHRTLKEQQEREGT